MYFLFCSLSLSWTSILYPGNGSRDTAVSAANLNPHCLCFSPFFLTQMVSGSFRSWVCCVDLWSVKPTPNPLYHFKKPYQLVGLKSMFCFCSRHSNWKVSPWWISFVAWNWSTELYKKKKQSLLWQWPNNCCLVFQFYYLLRPQSVLHESFCKYQFQDGSHNDEK